MIDLALRQRGAFSPRALFAKGEAGAWYDPSDLASMFQDAGGTVPAAVDAPVALIRDKSRRGNHAVQAAAGSRPVLRQEAGGRRYLEFDGIDDWMQASFAMPQPWERVSAVRQLSWTDGDRIFGSGDALGIGSLYQRTTSGQLRIYSGVLGPITSGLTTGASLVVSERHHGGTSRLAIGAGAAATGDAGAAAASGIELGGFGSGVNPGHLRLYGVAMIGRTLSDAEAARLRRFMAAKAGVAL